MGVNGPTYSSPGYNGAGACLWVNRGSNQYTSVASPFLNMAYKSFTVEIWVYPNILASGADYGIFAQTDAGNTSRALHLNIRNQRIYMGFFSDDLPGNTVSVDHDQFKTQYFSLS